MENIKEEYKECIENLRNYGNMRFAQLTLFIALTGGLLALIIQFSSSLEAWLCYALKIGGLAVAFIFLLAEERVTAYWRHFRRRADKLEENLGYKSYSDLKSCKIFSATNGFRALFILIIAFWVIFIIKQFLI